MGISALLELMEEKDKLLKTLWDEEGHLNTAIVAQPADKIAEMAEMNIQPSAEPPPTIG